MQKTVRPRRVPDRRDAARRTTDPGNTSAYAAGTSGERTRRPESVSTSSARGVCPHTNRTVCRSGRLTMQATLPGTSARTTDLSVQSSGSPVGTIRVEERSLGVESADRGMSRFLAHAHDRERDGR